MVLVMTKKQRSARASAQVRGISSCFERQNILFGNLYYTTRSGQNRILEISLDGIKTPNSKGSYSLPLLSVYSCLRKNDSRDTNLR